MSLTKHLKESIMLHHPRGDQCWIKNDAVSTTARNSGGTYAYSTLGAYSKVAMETVITDPLSAAYVDASTVGTTGAITVGASTTITATLDPASYINLAVGGLCKVDGMGGADAAYVNGQVFAVLSISGNNVELDVNTTGKTITSGGTLQNGEYGTITVPSGVKEVRVTGHISFDVQTNGSGSASVHLWRALKAANLTASGLVYYPGSHAWLDKAHRPTPECHYHNRVYYPGTHSTYISVLAHTPWIPVMADNEIWSLFAWQNSGGNADASQVEDNWLSVEFR